MKRIKLLAAIALAIVAAAALAGTASARVALDPGFSGDGALTTYVAQDSSGARQVVRTASGYIYTYGIANFNTGTVRVNDTVVNRYLHDGTPDPNWDGNGITYGNPDVLGSGPQAGGMVVNPDLSVTTAAASDGKIILERSIPTEAASGPRPSRSPAARVHPCRASCATASAACSPAAPSTSRPGAPSCT